MVSVEEIKNELTGKTNFEGELENDLFKRICTIEEAETNGELVEGLKKGDYILTVLFIVVLGLCPVLWYAIQYL